MIPQSALIEARHITVTASLVRECGGMNEAAIASLIAWKTEPDAPHAVDADDDGGSWWPASNALLADWTGLSVDQVWRALKKLLDAGHIERTKLGKKGFGDQTYAYRLVREMHVAESRDVHVAESRDLPIYETSIRDIPPVIPHAESQEESEAEEFERVWKAWPNKAAKSTARRRWGALSTKRRAEVIPLLVAHANAHRLHTPPQFIPHLATWLNQERWSDPLPQPRGGQASPAKQREAEALALYEHYLSQERGEHGEVRDGEGPDLPALGSGGAVDPD